MFQAIAAGVVYGLSAGFTPGPLFTLVLRQTLMHGSREGVRTAFAPLLTDGPIIVLVLIALERAQRFQTALGIVGLAGAAFLLYLAYETWTTQAPVAGQAATAPASLTRAVLINYLNPNPWLFWITVGGPTMVRAMRSGWAAVAAFIFIFLSLLIGSKVVMALALGRSRDVIIARWYRPVLRVLAVLLVVLAAMTAHDALALL